MLALLISLLSSLLVGFYIKYLKIKHINNLFVMVFVNYIVAIILCYSLFDINLSMAAINKSSIIFISALGFLMPSIFFVLNQSLKYSGLAKTDIFQRMSLIIPVALSFTLFNEQFTLSKFLVIILAFISIVLLLYKKSTKNGNFNIIYLLAVFLGYGIVDTLFKMVALNKELPYITVLFYIFIVCAVISAGYLMIFKGAINKKYLFNGVILGLLNFTNIYFYLKAHKIFSASPTLVFITMNLGVIIGGCLIGRIFFKEHLSKNTIIGVVLAIISVILLALIQLNKI